MKTYIFTVQFDENPMLYYYLAIIPAGNFTQWVADGNLFNYLGNRKCTIIDFKETEETIFSLNDWLYK